ncbi:MAG TPA: hypothetical protein VD788_17485, partial [Candidatus Polarisedimenticolaceae bacterium]|nr:hypothetical protein [Candidatus Polarisedimenticolaceae bacterium]
DQADACLSPDRATFYYWESHGWDRPGRLLRVPVGGGPSDLVLERSGAPWIACAGVADGPCLFFEYDDTLGIGVGQLDAEARAVDSVTTLDSETILGRPFALTATRTALSPDGRRIATIEDPVILLLDTATGEPVERIEITGIPAHDFSEIVWSPDGQGFYVIGETGRRMILLHVDRKGAARVLEESQTARLFAVRPSPDGRHLALGKTILDANVWMVDGR